jgi:cold shock protein
MLQLPRWRSSQRRTRSKLTIEVVISTTRELGTVKTYNVRRAFGFILPDCGGEDLFVHKRDVETPAVRLLQPGDRVDYIMTTTPRGPLATHVRVLAFARTKPT